MRISTVTMFQQSLSSMNRQQSDFLKVGLQIASGRRVMTPADDPQDASRAVRVSQAQAATQQNTDSRVSARNALSLTESTLNSVSDTVIRAKTLLVQAASDTLSDSDRKAVAAELTGLYETLVGQGNATDGNGNYLFGGYKDESPPFVMQSVGAGINSVQYVGDSNVREQRIDSARLMAVSDNGQELFQSVPSGAIYVARAERDTDGPVDFGTDEVGVQQGYYRNEGTVTFSGPNRIDTNHPDFGKPFSLTFTVDDTADPPVVTFSVTTPDDATGAPTPVSDSDGNPVTNKPYVSGATVEFGGINITLSGDPEDGDQIQMREADDPEANQDVFKTLKDAIDVLQLDQEGSQATHIHVRNTINTTMRELDNSLDNILTQRASVGARLNELDLVDTVSSNRMLNYDQVMSDLVDLDYGEAVTEYSLRQVGLQAAQRAFVDVQGMSLFDFMR
ncbi:flagellar hook-associated protein 3 [Halochromatium roseum]|nr:flagellar hook-associated protein 3 [Halochromatium roseum]